MSAATQNTRLNSAAIAVIQHLWQVQQQEHQRAVINATARGDTPPLDVPLEIAVIGGVAVNRYRRHPRLTTVSSLTRRIKLSLMLGRTSTSSSSPALKLPSLFKDS